MSCTGLNPEIVRVPAGAGGTHSSGVVGRRRARLPIEALRTNPCARRQQRSMSGGVGENAGLADCKAVHVPDGDRATVILQHEARLTVAVEIAGADDMPRGARIHSGYTGEAPVPPAVPSVSQIFLPICEACAAIHELTRRARRTRRRLGPRRKGPTHGM